MTFIIKPIGELNISTSEVSDLLKEVYVGEGYTSEQQGELLFSPDKVTARGHLLAAKHIDNNELAGLVILVPKQSAASKLAKEGEAEVHLLAVKAKYRKAKLAEGLMNALMNQANKDGLQRIILWTQTTMLAAQALYKKLGFLHVSDFSANNIDFYLFHKDLMTK